MTARIVGVGLLLSLMSVQPALSDELVLANASRGVNSDYAFAGIMVPMFSGTLGSGPAVRVTGDYLEYSYTGGVGPVNASGLGGSLGAVYQFSGGWGWANISAGGQYRDTHLSVFDPANTERGSRTYFNLQTDGGYNLDEAWRARGLATLTPTIHGYFTQIGIDRSVLQSVRLGINATIQGDRNYHQTSGGLMAFFQVAPNLELDPTVGVSHGGGNTGAFGGLNLGLVMH